MTNIEGTIELEFRQHVTEWKVHCKDVVVSSRPSDYTTCDAYRSLVAMGKDILPFVREGYTGKEEDAFFPIFGWADLIRDITGENITLPTGDRGQVDKVRDYALTILDQYLQS